MKGKEMKEKADAHLQLAPGSVVFVPQSPSRVFPITIPAILGIVLDAHGVAEAGIKLPSAKPNTRIIRICGRNPGANQHFWTNYDFLFPGQGFRTVWAPEMRVSALNTLLHRIGFHKAILENIRSGGEGSFTQERARACGFELTPLTVHHSQRQGEMLHLRVSAKYPGTDALIRIFEKCIP
ncbi:MAG: hypothetical protein WCW77_02435 [Patescibacteria group bacterium]